MTNFTNRLSFQSGMGLLEVLIGGGLIAGLGVAVMKMNESGSLGAAKVEKRMDIVNFDREVSNYLGDSRSCINSLGFNVVNLTSFTGSAKTNFAKIHNKNDVLVYNIPVQRGSVKLKQIYLTDYKAALNTARIIKEYEFQLTPTRKELKAFVGEVALVSVAGLVTSCVFKGGAGGDGPWVVEPSHIYYPAGNVGIGTPNPISNLHVVGDAPLLLIESTNNNSGVALRGKGGFAVGHGNGGIVFDNSDVTPSVNPASPGWGSSLAIIQPLFSGSAANTGADLMFVLKEQAGFPKERMRLMNNGNLGLGTNIPRTSFHILRDNTHSVITTSNYSNNPNEHGGVVALRARGTSSSSSYPLLGDTLGVFEARDAINGYDPITFAGYGGGGMRVRAAENFSSTVKGTNLSFTTTPNGTNTQVEQFIMSHDGSFGIGTMAPSAKLHISGGGMRIDGSNHFRIYDGHNIRYAQLFHTGIGAGNLHLDAYGGGDSYINWFGGDQVIIGNGAEAIGKIVALSFEPSDRRLKKNIDTIKSPWDTILRLRGVTFDWKNNDKADIGFIAQEVEAVIPQLVSSTKTPDNKEYKTLRHGNIIAVVIEGLKEIWTKVSRQEARIEKLEALNAQYLLDLSYMKSEKENLEARLKRIEDHLNKANSNK
jgi:hypothetical protein